MRGRSAKKKGPWGTGLGYYRNELEENDPCMVEGNRRGALYCRLRGCTGLLIKGAVMKGGVMNEIR
jgi:hypothetical protein